MWSIGLNFFLLSFLSFFVHIYGTCIYANHNNKTNPQGHDRLNALLNKRYFISTVDYIFYIGICTSAKIGVSDEVGVLQSEKAGLQKDFIVGRTNASSIKGGQNWLLLEYADGALYGTHCGKEPRKATLMFTCNEQITGDPLIRLLEENTAKAADCYYLFEIAHASICTDYIPSEISVGSILVISFCVIVTSYIVIGFLIQRCRGAKGMDQIPNYSMWQECGNLIADGCDLVFRSRPKATNHLYPPMDGHPRQTLQPDDRHLIDDDDNDDHMLPM